MPAGAGGARRSSPGCELRERALECERAFDTHGADNKKRGAVLQQSLARAPDHCSGAPDREREMAPPPKHNISVVDAICVDSLLSKEVRDALRTPHRGEPAIRTEEGEAALQLRALVRDKKCGVVFEPAKPDLPSPCGARPNCAEGATPGNSIWYRGRGARARTTNDSRERKRGSK